MPPLYWSATVYSLPPQYVARETPQYFEDTLADSAQWQADVYRLAAQLAEQAGVKHLIDIGCGNGRKLIPYASRFDITGIDYGANLEAFKYNLTAASFWER